MSDYVSPDVTVRGPGEDPEVTVVGGVHGDEPSGVRAIERILDGTDQFQRTVQFVRANPPALSADERWLDADLNRSFPGDPDSDDRERRLAAEILDVVGGTPTLSLHSTHSQPEPMALVSRDRRGALDLAAELPVPSIVDVSGVAEGTLTSHATAVTVEAGCQHSDAATETATDVIEAFLQRHDALPGDPPDADPTVYAMDEAVTKPDAAPEEAACSDVFDLRVENFQRVASGTVWATVDGETRVADDPFVPILMSECGYQDIFGYRGHRVGETVAAAREEWDR